MSERKEWFGLILRLVLGGVLFYASLSKLADPYQNVQSVRAYELLNGTWSKLLGYGLPLVEVLVGICLIVGLITRVSGVFAAGLMAMFIFGIASVWIRGININCGCFGDGGYDPNASDKYPWEIARDVGLFAMGVWLMIWPRTKLALDNLIFRRTPERILDGQAV